MMNWRGEDSRPVKKTLERLAGDEKGQNKDRIGNKG